MSPYADGGFVFCSGISDAGSVSWLCPAGTAFCDSTNPGNCLGCRSDSDCADQSLPSYDPHRQRCDATHSCAQCLSNIDCVSNPAGPSCNLNPVVFGSPGAPPSPAIAAGGFETCGAAPTDCRVDGSAPCDGVNQQCDATTGNCDVRAGGCDVDQDCAGLVGQGEFAGLPNIYCDHSFCDGCQGTSCPEQGCFSDSMCGNPDSDAGQLTCYLPFKECGCTDDAQCGGFWPLCLGTDAGLTNEFGQATGFCGCETTAQCGDAGLICYPLDLAVGLAGYCGWPCTASAFPACSAMGGLELPACDADSGFCTTCHTDQDCAGSRGSGGPLCFPDAGGLCGCETSQDCPTGWSCLDQPQTGAPSICQIAPAQCDPATCPPQSFCDWDSGACTYKTLCLRDSDCGPGAPFCDSDLRVCVDPHCR